MKYLVRFIFISVFGIITFYIVNIETERYESVSITLLKDLSKKQNMELSSLVLGETSSTMQDSKILELYIRSYEMYSYIDSIYDLSKHYTSDHLDKFQRLYTDADLPMYEASKKNLLKKYNDDLKVIFDEPSGTLSLRFIHTDPEVAQMILGSIIEHSDIVINEFSRENSQLALEFIEKQRKEDKLEFSKSIKKLITYQNKHHTIDPNMDVKRKNTILANLEAELIKAEVEYGSKSKSYNLNGSEMKILRETKKNLKSSIKRIKAEMVGSGDLNANVFDFELLRNDMEFTKEVYKQVLVNQEKLKLEVSQNAKHLIVVSKPTLADKATYPNKIWDIFTVFVTLIFLYNILMAIFTIIRDHKD